MQEGEEETQQRYNKGHTHIHICLYVFIHTYIFSYIHMLIHVYIHTYINLCIHVNKGQEVLLTDTVGFISKLPTDLIAAFRATLEEVSDADVLIHVCDRSSPVWKKQRETVLRELEAIGCTHTPIVELWNKVDAVENPDEVMLEAMTLPIDVDIVVDDDESSDVDTTTTTTTTTTGTKDNEEEYDDGVWDGDEEYIRSGGLGDDDDPLNGQIPKNMNFKREDIAANRMRAEVESKARLRGKLPYGPKTRKVLLSLLLLSSLLLLLLSLLSLSPLSSLS